LVAAVFGLACGQENGVSGEAVREQGSPITTEDLDGNCFRAFMVIGDPNGYNQIRYLDAYTSGGRAAVTRRFQDDDSQRWCFTAKEQDPDGEGGLPGIWTGTIQHGSFSSGLFLDAKTDTTAHEAFVRSSQDDGTQDWRAFERSEGRTMALVQEPTGRHLFAENVAANDFRVLAGPGSTSWYLREFP